LLRWPGDHSSIGEILDCDCGLLRCLLVISSLRVLIVRSTLRLHHKLQPMCHMLNFCPCGKQMLLRLMSRSRAEPPRSRRNHYSPHGLWTPSRRERIGRNRRDVTNKTFTEKGKVAFTASGIARRRLRCTASYNQMCHMLNFCRCGKKMLLRQWPHTSRSRAEPSPRSRRTLQSARTFGHQATRAH